MGIALGGCGATFTPPDDAPSVQEAEPNSTFAQAQAVTIPSSQNLRINGSVQGGQDVDVFDLGTFQAGQTLTAVLTGGSAINPDSIQFGFFDVNQEVAILDDNAATVDEQNISFVVRVPGKYYLALAQVDSSDFFSHTYSLLVTVGSSTVPSPSRQIFFLNFNGVSSVTIGDTPFRNLQPFSALNTTMSIPSVAAKTVDAIRGDYAAFNVQILSSYDTTAPSLPHSTVYISASSNDSFYGLSDAIDWYNENPSDNTVILAGGLLGSGLTQTQFITTLANVTAHEMGHLCGLAHTDDDSELMDQVTPLNALSKPQDFHKAYLAEFPIGTQDAIELLQFSLGILQ